MTAKIHTGTGDEMDTAEPPTFTHTEDRQCPPWCHECIHNLGPDGAFWHRGEPITVEVYGENEGFSPMLVLAEYFDKLPADRGCGGDPVEMEAPVVRLEVEAEAVGVSLTPARARQLAAALVALADEIEATVPAPVSAQPVAA